jgi:hypothetical protein
VAWGPIPGEIIVIPKGSGYTANRTGDGAAVKLSWSVTFRLPDCAQARHRFAPLEFSYDVSYDIDYAGYTTRTINGFIRIAMTLRAAGNKELPDSADRYREQCCPRFVQGFRRKPGRFKLNNAKDRLDFTILDEEMEGPAPPPGIVDCEASQDTGNAGGMNFAKWESSISAKYEMAKGVSVQVALDAFAALVKDRAGAADLYGVQSRSSKLRSAYSGSAVLLPVKFRMTRPNLYKRTIVQMSLQYIYFVANGVNGSFANAILASGMWRPVPGSDWKLWAASMAGILGPRGHANLLFKPNDDKITDLCSPSVRVAGTQYEFPEEDGSALLGALDISPPKAENSWLEYQSWIEVETDSGVVTYRQLSEVENLGGSGGVGDGSEELRQVESGALTVNLPLADNTNAISKAATPTLAADSTSGDDGATEVVSTAPTQIVLYLIGKAFRAGFQIPVPELDDVDGTSPVLANRLDANPKEGFVTGIFSNYGVPIYFATWRQRYIVTQTKDGKIPETKNPIFDKPPPPNGFADAAKANALANQAQTGFVRNRGEFGAAGA